MFIANTWRTLGRISEPQGCHYTVFLTSATFPSHPKTHDCNKNKKHAPSRNTQTHWLQEKRHHKNLLGLSGWHLELESFGCSCAGELGLPSLCKKAWINARFSLCFQSDRSKSREQAWSIPPPLHTRQLLSALHIFGHYFNGNAGCMLSIRWRSL